MDFFFRPCFFGFCLGFEIYEAGKSQLERANHEAVNDGIDHGRTVEQHFENILFRLLIEIFKIKQVRLYINKQSKFGVVPYI